MLINTKEKILEVAFVLFLNKGYDSVSISNIKKEANVGSGTIYNYFKSKEDLYDEVLNKYLINLFYIFIENIKNFNGNTKEKLIFFNMEFLTSEESDKYLRLKHVNYKFKEIDYRKMHFLYITGLQHHKTIKDKTERFSTDINKLLNEIIIQGKINNEIREDLDEKEIVPFILSTFSGIYFLWLNNDDLNLKEVVNSNVNHIWNYISK